MRRLKGVSIALLLSIAGLLLTSKMSHGQTLFFSSWQVSDWRLNISTSAQTIYNKNCSGVVTVTAGLGVGFPVNVTSNLTVNLASTSGTMLFYSNSSCTTPVSNVTIAAGSSSGSFYFYDPTVGTATVTVTATGYRSTSQLETMVINPYIWTGAATPNTLWSTNGNWSGGSPPGTTHTAIFDDTCIANGNNCNPTLTANIDIGGIRLDTGYTGTFTQGTSYDLKFRTGGFTQLAGTFVGSTDAARTMLVDGNGSASAGSFALSGGSFTAPTGTLTVTNNWQILNSPTFIAPAGSTVSLSCVNNSNSCDGTTYNMTFGNIVFHHLQIRRRGSGGSVYLGGTIFTVNGDLTLGDYENYGSGILNGTIQLYGNLLTTGVYGHSGSAVIRLMGNASGQTITGANPAFFPSIELMTGTHPVTLTGDARMIGWAVTSVGTFTATGSTLRLDCANYGTGSSSCQNSTVAITPGSVTYNHVVLTGYRVSAYNLGGGTMNVDGDFSMGVTSVGGDINNGTLKVKGNVSSIGYGGKGSAIIELIGNLSGQTITGSASADFPKFSINAGANNVTLSGGTVKTSGWDLQSVGAFTTTGTTLQIDCDANCAYSGGTQIINPGTVTYQDVVIQSWRVNWDFNGGTMNVDGNLVFGASGGTSFGQINNGTLRVRGNVTQYDTGGYGSGLLQLIGNASGQTITGVSGGWFPPIELVAGADNVTIIGTVRTMSWAVTSVGTLTTTGSTLHIGCGNNFSFCYQKTLSLVPGSYTYNHVTLRGLRTHYDLGGATWNIAGDLTFGDGNSPIRTINNGTLSVSGSVSILDNGNIGSVVLQMVGSGAVGFNIGSSAAIPPASISVAKTGGGSVTQSSDISLNNSGQDLTVSSGTWNKGTYSLTINDVFSVSAGASVNMGGSGTLSYGTFTNSGNLSGAGVLSSSGTLTNNASGAIVLTTGETLSMGGTLNNAGSITVGDGTLSTTGTLNNNSGTISIGAGTLSASTLTNSQTISILSLGTLTVSGTLTNNMSGVINLNGSTNFSYGTLSNLGTINP